MRSEYLGQLRVETTHHLSGVKIFTDAPPDNNGLGSSFSPTDLTCVSLASCMMTIIGIAARNRNFDLGKFSAEITKIMNPNPRKIAEIVVVISFEMNFEATDKLWIEKAALTCPVALSLHPDIKQNISFIYPKK